MRKTADHLTPRGFSLVEMAVVIVVLSIILAVIAQPVANQIETRRIADTQKQLEVIKEALYGFALVNKRLPRPVPIPDTRPATEKGTELATDCVTDVPCTGFIPWVTLGIDKNDAWGSIIRYSVTPAMTPVTTSAFNLSIGGTKDVVTRNGAGGVSILASNVAAVVWSHGKRNWGIADAETLVERPNDGVGNIDETRNRNTLAMLSPAVAGVSTVAGTVVFSRLPTDNAAAPGGEFDDLVSWIPTSILMGKMVQAGKLP